MYLYTHACVHMNVLRMDLVNPTMVKNSTNNDSHDNSGYIQGFSKALVLEKESLSD